MLVVEIDWLFSHYHSKEQRWDIIIACGGDVKQKIKSNAKIETFCQVGTLHLNGIRSKIT